ncbi:MAG: lytic transglycosylase domain-containing protein [Firmicutes bacterium]|nr:lytic transglycosylase domain-containing protein [Bacillota bacterium]
MVFVSPRRYALQTLFSILGAATAVFLLLSLPIPGIKAPAPEEGPAGQIDKAPAAGEADSRRPPFSPLSEEADLLSFGAAYRFLQEVEGGNQMPGARSGLTTLAEQRNALGHLAGRLLARHLLPGEPAQAAFYFRRADKLHSTRETRLGLALALSAAGRVEEARESFRNFLPDPAAVEGLLRTALSPITVARYLNDRGAFREAMELLTIVGTLGPEGRLEKTRALAGQGKHQEAHDAADGIPPDSSLMYPAVHLALGKAHEALSQNRSALRSYQAAGKAGLEAQGRLLLQMGQRLKAAEILAGVSSSEARWLAGRIYEELKMPEKALAVYLELGSEPVRVADQAAFRALVLGRRLGDGDRAGRAEGMLPAGSPWHERLGQEVTPEVEEGKPVTEEGENQPRVEGDPGIAGSGSGPGQQPIDLLSAPGIKLWEAGVTGWELAELEIEIARSSLSPAQLLELAEWYSMRGLSYEGLREAAAVLGRLPTIDTYRLAYPTPYRDIVEKAAAEFSVDPWLIYAVAREESHFRAFAVSRSGAIGLMQIMPSTGKWLAGKVNASPDVLSFFNVESNIRMGSWYLAYLLKLFNGDVDHALAAYNGGNGSVARWLKDPLYREPIDFSRTITFLETREYVDKVRQSYLVYRKVIAPLDRGPG